MDNKDRMERCKKMGVGEGRLHACEKADFASRLAKLGRDFE